MSRLCGGQAVALQADNSHFLVLIALERHSVMAYLPVAMVRGDG